MNESISNSPQPDPVEQPGIIFFIPCKANNAPLLVEAVQGIRRAVPEASVIILDDDRARCPQTVREVLRNMSVEWKVLKKTDTSSEHAAAILALMAQAVRHEHDVLVRTKPDNLILHAGFLREFARSEAGLSGTCLRSGLLCNELYALKPAVLRAILQHLEQSSSVMKCPEGAVILGAFTGWGPTPRQGMDARNRRPPVGALQLDDLSVCGIPGRHGHDLHEPALSGQGGASRPHLRHEMPAERHL